MAVLEDRLHRYGLRLDHIEHLVDGMTRAEEIATAVTSAMHADRRKRFNWRRRIAGTVGALIVMVPAAHELVVWVSSGG